MPTWIRSSSSTLAGSLAISCSASLRTSGACWASSSDGADWASFPRRVYIDIEDSSCFLKGRGDQAAAGDIRRAGTSPVTPAATRQHRPCAFFRRRGPAQHIGCQPVHVQRGRACREGFDHTHVEPARLRQLHVLTYAAGRLQRQRAEVALGDTGQVGQDAGGVVRTHRCG